MDVFMKNLEINVSFIPKLNAVKCAIPFGNFYDQKLEKIGRVVFANKLTGRSHIVIDENATGEEVQDMIDWVRRILKNGSSMCCGFLLNESNL